MVNQKSSGCTFLNLRKHRCKCVHAVRGNIYKGINDVTASVSPTWRGIPTQGLPNASPRTSSARRHTNHSWRCLYTKKQTSSKALDFPLDSLLNGVCSGPGCLHFRQLSQLVLMYSDIWEYCLVRTTQERKLLLGHSWRVSFKCIQRQKMWFKRNFKISPCEDLDHWPLETIKRNYKIIFRY